jgi:hypothetical protein
MMCCCEHCNEPGDSTLASEGHQLRGISKLVRHSNITVITNGSSLFLRADVARGEGRYGLRLRFRMYPIWVGCVNNVTSEVLTAETMDVTSHSLAEVN